MPKINKAISVLQNEIFEVIKKSNDIAGNYMDLIFEKKETMLKMGKIFFLISMILFVQKKKQNIKVLENFPFI